MAAFVGVPGDEGQPAPVGRQRWRVLARLEIRDALGRPTGKLHLIKVADGLKDQPVAVGRERRPANHAGTERLIRDGIVEMQRLADPLADAGAEGDRRRFARLDLDRLDLPTKGDHDAP